MPNYRKPLGTFLLVEDSEADRLLFSLALEKCDPRLSLFTAENGREAIQWLDKALAAPKRVLPDLILTDLKMPVSDGFDFLESRMERTDYRLIPVVVLSSSFLASDIRKAYMLGANAFITKPHTLVALTELIGTICTFWGGCERL